VSATLATSNKVQPVSKELLVVPTQFKALLAHANVSQVTLTTMECAPNALLEPSGAQPQRLASLSVVKTLSTRLRLALASVWLDLV
jgi:hypothetical protein